MNFLTISLNKVIKVFLKFCYHISKENEKNTGGNFFAWWSKLQTSTMEKVELRFLISPLMKSFASYRKKLMEICDGNPASIRRKTNQTFSCFIKTLFQRDLIEKCTICCFTSTTLLTAFDLFKSIWKTAQKQMIKKSRSNFMMTTRQNERGLNSNKLKKRKIRVVRIRRKKAISSIL